MLTIYGMLDSGNCYKPRLLMALTGQTFRHVETSTRDGTTRTQAFLTRNPLGQCPLLELDDGRFLAESGAILNYLGEGTDFVPTDRFERARMLQWMFFEQNHHEGSVAVRRSLKVYEERKGVATPERLALTLDNGNRALAIMQKALEEMPFFGGQRPSLADLALYPYTKDAPEGGFDLTEFPAIGKWLSRIEALPGYQPKTWTPA
ncbi:glutathione S-transferase family protein [Aureimonas fodinaquatilis]|uniref:Glutathione S-transferase family protein n=1 Tax=Aureimonas fodinaquatilis TaxID=2565783 RepID=A0A5B0E0H6_9HYPH|nr:glutathione S-transferase family protein [Aureimonas fodinaquatilis]KAA0971792.1 glutathione S-transferase family protein [Aureimonas fodinaquatilis]